MFYRRKDIFSSLSISFSCFVMDYAFWKLIITLKQSGSILVPFLYYRCIRNCVENRIDSYSHGTLYSQLNSIDRRAAKGIKRINRKFKNG